MEDRNYDPSQDQESSDDKTTEKKRRQGSFLARYLSRRRELSGEQKTDVDDDEEESEETPKRWSSFKKFFKNVVPPPENSTTGASTERSSNWLAWPIAEATTQEDVTPEHTETDFTDVTPQAGAEEYYEHTAEQPPVVTERLLPNVDVTGLEHPVSSDAAIEDAVDQLQPETADAPREAISVDRSESPDDLVPLQVRSGERSVIDEGVLTIPRQEVTTTTQLPAERERVIERGVGSALPVLLVGAEYLARKSADKKIVKTFTEKTDSLKKGVEQSGFVNQQLERLVKQNQVQLESLKQDRGISSELAEPVLTALQVETAPIGMLARPEVQQRPITTKETPGPSKIEQQPRPIKQEVIPQKHSEEAEPMPTQILEKVTEAADRDVPVERVFERSHEVKDDIPATVTSAASVGSVMSARAAQQMGYSFSKDYKQHSTSQTSDGLPTFREPQSGDLYKQAIQTGFGAAITIIVFGILAYLMVK